jgi:hypothetical protein
LSQTTLQCNALFIVRFFTLSCKILFLFLWTINFPLQTDLLLLLLLLLLPSSLFPGKLAEGPLFALSYSLLCNLNNCSRHFCCSRRSHA